MEKLLLNALAPQADGKVIEWKMTLKIRMLYRDRPNLVSFTDLPVAGNDIQEYLQNGIVDAQADGLMIVFDQTPAQYGSHVVSIEPYVEAQTEILATLMIFQKNGDVRWYYILGDRP